MSIETFNHNGNNVYNVDIMKPIYVSKITSAGQLSIPKELREGMGLGEEYVILELIGDVVVLRRIKTMKEEIFEYFDRETKARGITRKDIERAVKSAKKKIFEEYFREKA